MDEATRPNPPVLNLVVEVGAIRMPIRMGAVKTEAYIPRMCLVVDHETGMVLNHVISEREGDYQDVIAQGINEVADHCGGVPREVQVRDPKLATWLRESLEGYGVCVVVRESLPMLDEAFEDFAEFEGLRARAKQPALLDVPGMTLDHAIAFAEAAKAFYEAKPWRHLSDDDLIEIHAPDGPTGTRFAQVLGAGGRTFGLGFVASRKAHEDMQAGKGIPRGGLWALQFGSIDDLPFEDGELWERHQLPVADEDAFAYFLRMSRSAKLRYPTPEQIIWAEGLLRALAASSADEFDAGRWERQVETLAGAATYRFALPLLLEQMAGRDVSNPAQFIQSTRMQLESMLRGMGQKLAEAGPLTEEKLRELNQALVGSEPVKFEPRTPAERAQALCYQAYEARGRRQVQLAREALSIDPDFCEALVLLAERAGGDELALPLYRRAIEAGERQLGPEQFEQNAGHFWGVIETRPYMRARELLALALMNVGRFDEAAAHFNDMLRLNPNDNQGIRYHLAQCLLHEQKLDELDQLLNHSTYHDDFSAEWGFTKAMLEYRRDGDSPAAQSSLNEAQRRNAFVAPLLIGRDPIPPVLPETIVRGAESEAVACVETIAPGWHETPGATEWLDEIVRKQSRAARKAQRDQAKPTAKRKKRG